MKNDFTKDELASLLDFSERTDLALEEEFLQECLATHPKHYKKVLLIGRFQPLHRGHILLIKFAHTLSNSLIIGVGSANKNDKDNPYSLEKRVKLLEYVLKKEGLGRKIEAIVPLNDNPSDDDWREAVLKKVGHIDAIIGNNEWPNQIFERVGIPAIRTSLFQREIFEGKRIREGLRASQLNR